MYGQQNPYMKRVLGERMGGAGAPSWIPKPAPFIVQSPDPPSPPYTGAMPTPAPAAPAAPQALAPRGPSWLPQQGATPQRPQAPPAFDADAYTGRAGAVPAGRNPRWYQRQASQMMLQNAQFANPALIQALRDLMMRANTGQFSGERQADYLAPRMELLDRSFDRARGQAGQGLMDRGLADSSYGAAVESGLDTGEREARARVGIGLRDAEHNEQERNRAMLLQALTSMMTGGASGAAGIAGQTRGQDLQFEEMTQGGLWEDLLGLAGAVGGAYAGGGMGRRKSSGNSWTVPDMPW